MTNSNTSQSSPQPLSPDRLQEIRDADAMAGDSLQNCPATWQHRRDLLAYIEHQQNGIDERAKRFVDGQMLYAFYTNANAQQNCAVDEWRDLPTDARNVWEQMAEDITMGFRQ